MRYFSTNKKDADVSFREAVLNGQPNDGGLYFPSEIPKLPDGFWKNFQNKSQAEIAFDVIEPFVGNDINFDLLHEICAATIDFEFPLVRLEEDIYTLELFHGPTLAFKDVGARFISRCVEYFAHDTDGRVVILVATSGDTGGAVAAAFSGTPGVDVVILFPKDGVSRFQELQLTGAGDNVHAVEVDGVFDDCQRLVKTAFADQAFNGKLRLISANSINVARWLPQQFYYFFALQQWTNEEPPVICVPSGNFGNIAAGLTAMRRGLPCSGFIAATNRNDTLPRYLETGSYNPKPSMKTLSNAMDVGDPSNLVRLRELFGNKLDAMRNGIWAISISDEETAQTIAGVNDRLGYILDPHGAVGYAALRKYLNDNPGRNGIFLETAHPAKFDSVEKIIGRPVPNPGCQDGLRTERKMRVENNYEAIRNLLLKIC
jgi:threonine synthase